MAGWIRLHSEPEGTGQKVTLSASPELEIDEETYRFATQEEMQQAMQRILLYAEDLLRNGRVDSIHMNADPYPPPAPGTP